ncbi:MAG: Pvc16 family protein [candidate division KSB1 bacterium]|nr:Pvc16 family protein [candidate division KSB1 bacterium]MDZ7273993.1 Pvc16 family protein [candidate division KSB1 bacterium]MDZ7286366.1 Pvc16 family protein [candidate division KSB1 bacterium]MDZ7296594.1 Pvc16 family protein [candidate division KSB1 bacterium]MDZ7309073.1 Pvc16 family protein [candidate division KSB1 bacterium]
MFRDLDDTLKNILDDAEAPDDLESAEVSFLLPDKTFLPDRPTLNLFLYNVHENRVLRDPVPIIEKSGTSYVRRTPPLRVDCSYMVTAWGDGSGEEKAKREHRLLSQALQWLSRFPVIPDRYLVGSLQNPPFPHRTEVALPNGEKSMGEFWTALGQPPRPSFNLLVTIAMDSGVKIAGPLVTTHSTGTDAGAGVIDETWIQIGGRVLNPTGQGIANALVDIIDAGLRTPTDAEGRYSFPRVPVGTRTIRVVAVGFAPKTQSVPVPGRPEDYEIILTPL